MSKRIKILMATLLAVVLTLGVVGGVVLAQEDEATTPPAPYEVFLDKLAAKLDVSVDQLKAAFNEAREGTLDEMVGQGRITEQQRDQALQRMEQGCYYGDGTTGCGRHSMGGCFGGPSGTFTPPCTQSPTQ
jgi:hypothetical protein